MDKKWYCARSDVGGGQRRTVAARTSRRTRVWRGFSRYFPGEVEARGGSSTPWSVLRLETLLLCLSTLILFCRSFTADDDSALNAAVESIRIEDLRRHQWTLASDSFEGREGGSRGGRAAAAYLRRLLSDWNCQGGGDDGDFYQDFGQGFRNVLVVVPGNDPELRDEYILVSAHYDHVGYGTASNSRGPHGFIHNGADDNASGTTGLLEVLEAVTQHPVRLRRSLLIAFWDAEEKGLLGSKYWLTQPTVPLNKIRLVINSDMIGRLTADTLIVHGTRTGVGLRRLASSANRNPGLKLDFTWKIEDNSDHWPFYRRQIPFLMLHTGLHDDYHRPSDDVEKINLAGEKSVTQYLLTLTMQAANSPASPFRRESFDEDVESQARFEAATKPFPPRLGITWDAELDAKHVIEVTRVRPDSPAANAGLQVGDRILEFDGIPLTESNDIRYLVQRAPVETSCRVQRPGLPEPIDLSVQLDHSPLILGVAWQADRADPACAVLTDIVPGSPLAKAGLKRGDRVYAIGGVPLASESDFRDKAVSQQIPSMWTVERDGSVREVAVIPVETAAIAAESAATDEKGSQ